VTVDYDYCHIGKIFKKKYSELLSHRADFSHNYCHIGRFFSNYCHIGQIFHQLLSHRAHVSNQLLSHRVQKMCKGKNIVEDSLRGAN